MASRIIDAPGHWKKTNNNGLETVLELEPVGSTNHGRRRSLTRYGSSRSSTNLSRNSPEFRAGYPSNADEYEEPLDEDYLEAANGAMPLLQQDAESFDLGQPNEAQKRTLRRVSDKLPWSAFLVAIVELCERFAYYGVLGPFQNYISNKYKDPSGNPGAIGMLPNFFQSCTITISSCGHAWWDIADRTRTRPTGSYRPDELLPILVCEYLHVPFGLAFDSLLGS
jgi:hypothetical protein